MEERGFDTTVTAGGVYELLREAGELVPGMQRAGDRGDAGRAAARHAGQRCRSIGRRADGVWLATGHGRNGVLLAPLTGDLVAGALAGRSRRGWTCWTWRLRPGATGVPA